MFKRAGLGNDTGSSPLTRGTRENSSPHEFHGRFIPAYAGNSVLPAVCMRDRSVHPRLRGELYFSTLCLMQSSGSSPLTRGTHLPGLKQKDKDRFIPAYAGNSVSPASQASMRPVHPRLRGELFDPSRSANSRFPVHPRLRGELQKNNHWQQSTSGSSPLTRGTRVLLYPSCLITRFIPAYAGNSRC